MIEIRDAKFGRGLGWGGGAQKKGGLYTTKFDNSPCVATTFQKTLFFINYKN